LNNVFIFFGDGNVQKIGVLLSVSSSILNFMVGVMVLKIVTTSRILVVSIS
jgi:hypothetical protein